MREKGERKRGRKGLDFGEKCDNNVATFFSHTRERIAKNCDDNVATFFSHI
jgi:hypothetical protein